jgi:hypothetical protein
MKINENPSKSMKIIQNDQNSMKSIEINEIYEFLGFESCPGIVVPLLKSNHGDLFFGSGIRGGIQMVQIN